MREITVATVQMHPQLDNPSDNLIKMGEFISKIATEQPVDLIVFPELATTGYEAGPRFTRLAEQVPGPTVNLLAQKASTYGVHIAFGMVVKERVESILYNAAVLVNPEGNVVGVHRKIHLKAEERMAFRAGFKLMPMETEFGNVGLMVGWDLAFPEVARSLALEGADLLVVCANWEEPRVDEWRTLIMARAYENCTYVAGANRIGEEPSYTFCGQSAIVGPRGQLFATVDEAVEGYAVARFDLDEVRRVREETQSFQCREPSAYRALVRRY